MCAQFMLSIQQFLPMRWQRPVASGLWCLSSYICSFYVWDTDICISSMYVTQTSTGLCVSIVLCMPEFLHACPTLLGCPEWFAQTLKWGSVAAQMVLYVRMYVCRSTSFMGTHSSSVCGDPTLATPTNVARDYTPPQLFLPVCTMLPHTYTKGTVWCTYVVISCLTTWQAYCVWQACTYCACVSSTCARPLIVCTVSVHSCFLLSLACDGCPQRGTLLWSGSVLSSLLPIESFFPLTTQAPWGMSLCYVRSVMVNALSLFSYLLAPEAPYTV